MLRRYLPSVGRSSEPHQTAQQPTWTSRLSTFAVGLGVLLVLLICYLAYELGLLANTLFILLLVASPVAIVDRLWRARRKTLEFRLVRHPLSRDVRWYLLQCLNRWACLVLIAISIQLAIIPFQLSPETYRQLQILVVFCTLLLMLLALIPPQRIRLSTNLLFAAGWVFLGMQMLRIMQPPQPEVAVVLDAPFRGEWYVFHGGRSAVINHHYPLDAQRDALDLVATRAGRQYLGDPSQLESYFAFGQMLNAPADGRVVRVVADRPDLAIGETDATQPAGNYVTLELGDGRFVTLAHLRQGSVQVRVGDDVTRGQVIAQCGNSGNTSEPHLHMQVQSHADFFDPQQQTYPILFRQVTRVRAGHAEQLMAADVQRNDQVIAVEE